MDSFSTHSRGKRSTNSKRPIVSQEWLEHIAGLEMLGKSLLEEAKEERAKVLEMREAGALIEPGRYKVRVRTRWRRRKASP